MRISENALNILTAKTYRGIGRAWIVKNLKGNESVDHLVRLLNESVKGDFLITPIGFEHVRDSIRESISGMSNVSDGVTAIGDKDFPLYRGIVKNSDQPIAIFYRGNLTLLNKSSKNIAVIGLLTPDRETEMEEAEMVSGLVTRGAVIVSGLALGCDAVAHRQALRSGGRTVAILPSPLNRILPSENSELAEDIVKKDGLLITEYYDQPKSKMELSGRYQDRDRLQALFSDCVILAASYAKNDLGLDSGARLAMEYARNYSIQRAVLYDLARDATNPKFDLNRQMIREQSGIPIINRKNMNPMLDRIVCGPQSAMSFRQTGLFE